MTAAELAQLWEGLAARCPELRPRDGEWSLGFVLGADVYFPVLCRWESASDPETHNESPAVVSALFRDSAVLWLAVQTQCLGIRPPAPLDPTWTIEDQLPTELTIGSGPTLDHALAAAVGAVLDQQEAR